MTRRTAIAAAAAAPFVHAAEKFDASWESLQRFRCPEWFRDAKLGIWAHWGPQCVPEQGDWYARNMYMEGSAHYEHHVRTYGHPSKFGYKDVLALWKAERFDPAALVRRYKDAGAKYFVALAVHHDNFDCWNSKHHSWNSVRVGPKKDIVGLWRDAARREGLRFGVSEHHARSWSWFNTNKGADKKGPLAGVPYDGADPRYASLYHPPHDETTPRLPERPSKEYVRNWYERITDLIDKYRPDLLYTDGGIAYGETGRRLLAHYYNAVREPVYTLKDIKPSKLGTVGEYRDGVGVLDLERGIVDDIRTDPWQTDTCIGNWFYKRGAKYKSAATVIHMLADIVSKNGNLLLNFPLRPDGTLDAETSAVVDELARWMRVNGEAIYGTRPWKTFGEGPRRETGGAFNEQKLVYGPEDIRFTAKPGAVYAICLGTPGEELALRTPVPAQRATILGGGEALSFRKLDNGGIAIRTPRQTAASAAVVFKLSV